MKALKALLLSLAICGGLGEVALARPHQPVNIELQPYRNRLRTVEVVIGGQPARMLFDTGAGITLVSPSLARAFGCEPWGQIVGFRMNGERVSFQRCAEQTVHLGAFSVRRDLAVFDVGALLPADWPPIDGVAGLDLFEDETITLTHGLGALRIESPRSQRRATHGLTAGRIRLSREAGGAGLTAFAPVASPRGDLWLLIDSGNLAGFRLSPLSFEVLGGGERINVSVAGAAPTEIEPEVVPDLIYDGALNAAFIAAHDVTLDLGRRQAWWRPAP